MGSCRAAHVAGTTFQRGQLRLTKLLACLQGARVDVFFVPVDLVHAPRYDGWFRERLYALRFVTGQRFRQRRTRRHELVEWKLVEIVDA